MYVTWPCANQCPFVKTGGRPKFFYEHAHASLYVIWAQSEEKEEEGTFWGKKAFSAI